MLRLIPIFILFLTFFSFVASESMAQKENSVLKTAFQEGSFKDISRFFDDRVEISLDNDKGDYSRSQAEIVLRDFFRNNPVENFELQQEGQTANHLSYLIGTYHSLKMSYRVLIRGKIMDNTDFLIYSLGFIRQ
ncbi:MULTISPECIES: DUF4783 domain-containing protein [Cyclobacterium]|uniref:DUF4783 domain-containing protein n=1 Tax=Cyclobacterium plantarum TaxID=2716263 RepID=A0ABX0H3X4_9BACT|nr:MULTISPECIES: DUF4783 domain-containing protein [Cyclobacterium]MBD3629175.1 DUF4783 domain-containing protein [Cyclobacterium sp.]NHE55256.1 DUF4783 domain-containing protein [Cyclobacterium plantarum]